MYYLVVTNLGIDRCVHRGEDDIYSDGKSFSCAPDLDFPGGELVRKVKIRCTEAPDPPVDARVYTDPEDR